MARLTHAEIRTRRAMDYRVNCAMDGNDVLCVSAHRTLSDLNHGRVIDHEAGLRGEAEYYLAAYYFPVLIGPGQTTTEPVIVAFDISSGGYPYAEPRVTVISRPMPWSPHVHPSTGTVCLGETWKVGRGKMLLAQLILHVARILNCDEPDRGPSYTGWNGAAVHYWRTVMQKQPLNPELAYPVPSVDITHGTSRKTAGDDSFAPVADTFAAVEESFSPVCFEVAS